MVNAIDELDNIEDVNKLFKVGNVSKEVAEEALEMVPKFADTLNDTVKGAAEGAEAITNLQAGVKGLASSTDEVVGLGTAFKGLGLSLKSLLLNPTFLFIGGLVTATAVTMYGISKKANEFKKSMEEAAEAQSKYAESSAELQSINSELDNTNSKIDELKSKGTLTLAEEGELEKLQAQSAELERQIKLLDKKNKNNSKKATKEALDILNAKDTIDLTQTGETQGNYGMKRTYHKKTDMITATENELKALEELKKKERKLLSENSSKGTSKERKKEIEKELKEITSEMDSYDSAISRNIQTLSELKNNLVDQTTGKVKSGYEEMYSSINKLIDGYNNIDLSPVEQKFKKIDSYFNDGTGSKSFLVDQLKEMASQSQLTEEDIKRMGVAIEGVDASEIAKYFNDMAKSANEAANATSKFGTLGEYKQALETANPGQDYLDIVEGIKKTKELYDQGLVGTDEFKSFAKMLSPSGATDGKNYIENYNRLGKYFNSDNASGMNSFLIDLSKKTDSAGKSFASLDKKTGQWKINIKDTSEAAKQLGIGIVPFESMLKRLQDYNFDIDFHSAVEDFESVKTSLGGFDSVLERMQDGERKIKLEYSLAEIQAQIDEFKSKIDWGNANSENYANLLSGNDKYINTAINNLGLNKQGIKVPVEFTTNESKIEKLKQQLAKTTDEKTKIKIQAEIANIQEVQKNLMDAFSDAHPEINADSSIEEIANALDSFFKSNEARKILLGLDTSEAKQQLDGILSNDGKVITMNVDASTEQIQKQLDLLKEGQTIVFNADINGVQSTISAIKNEDGTLSYYAQIDGVVKELKRVENKDGTITYKPDTTAVDAETLKKDGGTRYVLYQANTTGLPTYFNPITRTVEYKYKGGESSIERFNRTGSAIHYFNGTAHANGTLLNTRKGNAFASGNWGAKKSEKALVGELGQELLVRGSHFETIGDNGAEFANIRKGDVIFNHKQTEELLKNGYVTSGGGRAKVVGGAFASGTAYAGSTTGSGKLPSGSSSSKKKKKKSSSKSSDKATKDAADKAKEAAESVIDFVEIAIKRIDEGIKRIKITAESTFKTFSKRNNALGQEMSAIVNKINVSQQAYNKYMSQANKVGLSENYAKQVRDGSINIETIKDENLSKKINDYQEW